MSLLTVSFSGTPIEMPSTTTSVINMGEYELLAESFKTLSGKKVSIPFMPPKNRVPSSEIVEQPLRNALLCRPDSLPNTLLCRLLMQVSADSLTYHILPDESFSSELMSPEAKSRFTGENVFVSYE